MFKWERIKKYEQQKELDDVLCSEIQPSDFDVWMNSIVDYLYPTKNKTTNAATLSNIIKILT